MSRCKPRPAISAEPKAVRSTIRLRSGVTVDPYPSHTVVRHPWGAVSIEARPEVRIALCKLSAENLDSIDIAELVAGGRSFDDLEVMVGLAQLDLILKRLPFLVAHSVFDGIDPVVMVEPICDRASGLNPELMNVDAPLSLDRFAYIRRRPEKSGLCLESPLAFYRSQLGSSLLPLIARIASDPLVIDEINDERELAAIRLLVCAGLVHAGRLEDVEEERLATWSFHDLLFHSRSRPGRNDNLVGAHFLHRDRFASLPAVPAARTGPAIDLPLPQFADVVARDRSLTEVMESRRSVREYSDHPVTVEHLGELLYRSARTRGVEHFSSFGPYDGADHPYPTGGLAADLELYLSVAHCAGLAAGIYHYESGAHRLRLINDSQAAAPLLSDVRAASGGIIEPQVLLTITSRFARTAWKYETIAYALTLKHVGVLMQTLYLVATSMGLAPCALGSGNADLGARAFKLDWLVESSVGEVAIGSRVEPLEWVNRFTDIVADTRII